MKKLLKEDLLPAFLFAVIYTAVSFLFDKLKK